MFPSLAANLLVLALWTALSPLHWEVEVQSIDQFDRETETYGYCSSDSATVYLVALCIINLGPLVLAVYEAYVARDISTEFSETEYILRALAIILLVCFVGIPVIIIARENPAAYFFVLSAIIFVTCTSILLLIFCPKLHFHYNERFQKPERRRSSVPFKFTRHGSEMGFHLDESKLGGTTDRSGSTENEGLLILKHPKTQRSLEEANQALLNENEELKEKIQQLQAVSEISDGMADDDWRKIDRLGPMSEPPSSSQTTNDAMRQTIPHKYSSFKAPSSVHVVDKDSYQSTVLSTAESEASATAEMKPIRGITGESVISA